MQKKTAKSFSAVFFIGVDLDILQGVFRNVFFWGSGNDLLPCQIREHILEIAFLSKKFNFCTVIAKKVDTTTATLFKLKQNKDLHEVPELKLPYTAEKINQMTKPFHSATTLTFFISAAISASLFSVGRNSHDASLIFVILYFPATSGN